MIKKRNIVLLSILSIIAFFSIINFVSAQPQSNFFESLDLGIGITQIIYQMTEFFRPIFEFLLGPYASTQFFYAKVLLLILMFVFVYWALDRLPLFQGYRSITLVIATAVSILAIRYLSENDLILGILLPYGTFGVVLTTLIPFFLFGYMIHATGMPGIGRKVGWGFFGIVFFILWRTKAGEIGDISNYIYTGTLIGVAVMLVFDKSVHAYFRGLEMKEFEKQTYEAEVANLQRELFQLAQSGASGPQIDARTNRIKRRLRHLGAKYAS
ncbi:hypothetical protein HYW74_04840 [Candidatus Pacearchaeota archaeon]|nr:hypothetical protein [Candidatus Pacearchaeota archaeon]